MTVINHELFPHGSWLADWLCSADHRSITESSERLTRELEWRLMTWQNSPQSTGHRSIRTVQFSSSVQFIRFRSSIIGAALHRLVLSHCSFFQNRQLALLRCWWWVIRNHDSGLTMQHAVDPQLCVSLFAAWA